jgi:CheY-like chemotaxis protein
MHELVADVQALMMPAAQAKALQLSTRVDPALPSHLRLDGTRLRQVVFNLLSNAIKFTDRGSVGLDVRAEDGRLLVAVSDTGIGMDEATVARLFQRFSRGDETASRRHGGTGLGLEISRSLARLMGGDIDVASAPGQGSRFLLRLPLTPAPAAAELDGGVPTPAAAAARGLRLLVAEDNPVNREVLAAMLAHLGHEPAFAVDGHAALEAARRARFDVVLMDLHMPGLDGFAATREIRALGGANARMPIVALTADAFADTRTRCLEVGMSDFITKPVALDALAVVLARHAGDASITAEVAATAK